MAGERKVPGEKQGCLSRKYFVGNARSLKKLEMDENPLRDDAKVVIPEHGTAQLCCREVCR